MIASCPAGNREDAARREILGCPIAGLMASRFNRPSYDAASLAGTLPTIPHGGHLPTVCLERPYLAAYAGLSPVTRRSGSSIRGEHPSRRGNKILKRALFLSAFAALRDPISRAYYDRKIHQGKRHNQALIALARRRCDVLYAMLRDRAFYHATPTANA